MSDLIHGGVQTRLLKTATEGYSVHGQHVDLNSILIKVIKVIKVSDKGDKGER